MPADLSANSAASDRGPGLSGYDLFADSVPSDLGQGLLRYPDLESPDRSSVMSLGYALEMN